MIIHFKDISSQLGTRFEAESIRLAAIDAMRHDIVVTFDLQDVEVITNSFADECFGKLLLEFEMTEIKSMSKFINANSFVSSSIAHAVNNRIVSLSNI